MPADSEILRDSKIILLSGTKGGCGCSFIANTVASFLAMKKSKNILLLDLNAGKKDSRVIFDLDTTDNRDLGDISENIKDIDISALKRLVVNFDNSLNIILPSLKFEKDNELHEEGLMSFLKILSETFDLIIIDFPYYKFLAPCRILLEMIDKLVLVSQADIVSINNMSSIIKNLDLENTPVNFEIVINKFNLKQMISPARIINILKYPINTFIPYDRDIELLYLMQGPFPVFKYNLRIVKSICCLAEGLFEIIN